MSDISNYSLESLLAHLETGLSKSASDESEKDEKADKDEKKELPAFLKKDGDKEKSEKGEKSESSDDEDKEGQTKEASDAGAALAREIMAKVASTQVQNIKPMNKQASVAGQALAQALLQKRASAGDFTTENGVVPGTAGSKVIADNAQMEAEGASYIKPMPTGDGIRNTGTVNQIFDAVIADALGQGATGDDQVHQTGVDAQEGAAEDHAVPNQVKVAAMNELLAQGVDFDEAAEMVKSASEQEASDNMEKAAAIDELVGRGIDFEDAVELVKQAAEEIEMDLEKAAALDQLVSEGVDFNYAVALVKQASAGDMASTDGTSPGTVPNKTIADNAQMNAEGDSSIKPMPTGDGIRNQGSVNQIFDAVVADALAQGAAGEDQVHQTGVAGQEGNVEDHAVPNQVKVAAMNRLLEGGVNFDEAADLVKQANALALMGSRALVDTAPIISPLSRMDRLKSMAGKVGKFAKDNRGHIATGAALTGTAGLGYAAGAHSKQAAMNFLMDNGVDFDAAATFVKEAGVGDVLGKAKAALGAAAGKAKAALKGSNTIHVTSGGTAMGARTSQARGAAMDFGKKVKGHAANFAADAKGVAKGGDTLYVTSGGKVMGARGFHGKNLATNPLTLAGLGTAGVAGGAYALTREKKAAFDALVEGGVDFDTAAVLVANKARELYGE